MLLFSFRKLFVTLVRIQGMVASFPGPAHLSVACSTEKRGEPGIFSHVIDVTTYEKLMNVGGLNDNGVIAYALVPRRWSESLCLRTELCDFHAKCTFLSTAEDSEARTDCQSERKPALPLYTQFQCVESKRLLQK